MFDFFNKIYNYILNFFNKCEKKDFIKGRIRVRNNPRIILPSQRRTTRTPQQPNQPQTSQPQAQNSFVYFMNDKTTPDMQKIVFPPPQASPAYLVQGYKNVPYPTHSSAWRSACVYKTITDSLNMTQNALDVKINRWAATNILQVAPEVPSNNLNAFYNRTSLQFFAAPGANRQMIYTGESVDIVSHELGHAILDSLRPDLWNITAPEVWAFHESFADFIAMMTVLQHDEVIHYMLRETNNDLRNSNIISKIAEEFGNAIYANRGFLRNANNNFVYQDPTTLQKHTPDNMLSSEPHNFSRVMTGLLYECFTLITTHYIQRGVSPFDSVKQSRNVLLNLVLLSVRNTPLSVNFYDSFCKTLLWASTQRQPELVNLLRQSMQNRNMLRQSFALNNDKGIPGEIKKLSEDHVCVSVTPQIRGINIVPRFVAEFKQEFAKLFDNTGNLIGVVESSKYEVENHLNFATDYLIKNYELGNEGKFKIDHGVLVRNYIKCNCGG